MATEGAMRQAGWVACARSRTGLVEDLAPYAAGEPRVVGIACLDGNGLSADIEATAGEHPLRIVSPTNAAPGPGLHAHHRELLHVVLDRNPSRMNRTDIDWKRDLVR